MTYHMQQPPGPKALRDATGPAQAAAPPIAPAASPTAHAVFPGNQAKSREIIKLEADLAADLATIEAYTVDTQRQGYTPCRKAMDDRSNAKAELTKATPNKGGHRERALGLIDQAMGEVRAGIAFAGGG